MEKDRYHVRVPSWDLLLDLDAYDAESAAREAIEQTYGAADDYLEVSKGIEVVVEHAVTKEITTWKVTCEVSIDFYAWKER